VANRLIIVVRRKEHIDRMRTWRARKRKCVHIGNKYGNDVTQLDTVDDERSITSSRLSNATRARCVVKIGRRKINPPVASMDWHDQRPCDRFPIASLYFGIRFPDKTPRTDLASNV